MKRRYTEIFIYLVMLYISSILIANIAAFKLVKIFSLTMTAGTLVFPISYILGDVFSEIYGFKITKRIIFGGFLCNALMVFIFAIAIKLPYPDYFTNQDSFALVLGNTPRLFIASILAYLIGGLSNSYIMQFIMLLLPYSFMTELKSGHIRRRLIVLAIIMSRQESSPHKTANYSLVLNP